MPRRRADRRLSARRDAVGLRVRDRQHAALASGHHPPHSGPLLRQLAADPVQAGSVFSILLVNGFCLLLLAGFWLGSPPARPPHSGVTYAAPTLVAHPKELQALMGNKQGRFLLIMPVLLQTALFPFAATLEVTGNTGHLQPGWRCLAASCQRLTHMPAFTTIIPVQGGQARPSPDNRRCSGVIPGISRAGWRKPDQARCS